MTEGNLIGRMVRDHLAGRLPGLVGADRAVVVRVGRGRRGRARGRRRAGAPGSAYLLGGDQRAADEGLRNRARADRTSPAATAAVSARDHGRLGVDRMASWFWRDRRSLRTAAVRDPHARLVAGQRRCRPRPRLSHHAARRRRERSWLGVAADDVLGKPAADPSTCAMASFACCCAFLTWWQAALLRGGRAPLQRCSCSRE